MDETGAADIAGDHVVERRVTVTQGSAASLPYETNTVTHICVDPPYYDNVMYAELADYFYVWEKRTLGRLVPEYFNESLSDKENEAVARPGTFCANGTA